MDIEEEAEKTLKGASGLERTIVESDDLPSVSLYKQQNLFSEYDSFKDKELRKNRKGEIMHSELKIQMNNLIQLNKDLEEGIDN